MTWSNPQGVLAGEVEITDFNIGGDPDTLSAGSNIDGTYIGEDFQLTFTGGMNALLRYVNILHWSHANGLTMIALAHQVPGLGALGLATNLRQANMGTIAYPTITASEDGQRIVVAFSAVDQRPGEVPEELVSTASELGYLYYRLWAVGSKDGGQTWGTPFIVQDFAGDGTDSASIEYPAAAPVSRMVSGDLELNLVFQAKRSPGQFAFNAAGQDPGVTEDVYQYFQRFAVTPAMFQSGSSADLELGRTSGLTINSLAPNPADDRMSVAFSLARAGDVRGRIIDNLGRIAATNDSHREAGLHTMTFDVSELASGAYRVVIEHDGGTVSAPVIVR